MSKTPALSMLLLVSGIFMAPAHGQAFCTPAPATLITVPSISNIPSNPAFGEVLGDPDGYTYEILDAQTCTYDSNLVDRYWTFMTLPPNTGFTGQWITYYGVRIPVYLTGLRGVGFGVLAQDRDGGRLDSVSTGITSLRPPINPGLPTWGVRGRLFFFATGPIDGGLVPSRTVGRLHINNAKFDDFHAIIMNATLVGPPRKPTCLVTTPSLTLNLGSIDASSFNGVGSVSGNASADLVLQCAEGTGLDTNVLVTLTDQTDPANRSDQLSLTRMSSASGIALQLLHGAELLRYGPDSSAVGNPNQWSAGSTGNGMFRIPLTARFVQTRPRIQPGSANGLATFTLSYR